MTLARHEQNWMRCVRYMANIFSTCSRRQYAAVVIAPNKRVVGFGYNGAPPNMKHCNEGGCPRGASTVAHRSSYDSAEGFCIAQHAEAGALLWSDPALRQGGTIIVNGTPCLECARLIASSGLARVVCLLDDIDNWDQVKNFLTSAGLTIEEVPLDGSEPTRRKTEEVKELRGLLQRGY